MPKLNWISDDDLTNAVAHLLSTAKNAKNKASKKFGENVIDPFSAIFEIPGFEIDYDKWVLNEKIRQAQKTLQNSIGEFHQNILGSCAGWKNMKKGNIIDLFNEEKQIIAEVKNKYNTISGGKQSDLYKSLESAVMDKTSIYKNFTAYYVSVIPKKPDRFNIEFTPSDKGKGQRCPQNKLIRQTDGASFYAMATGEEAALENLFNAIPFVIEEYSNIKIMEKEKLSSLFKLAYGENSSAKV